MIVIRTMMTLVTGRQPGGSGRRRVRDVGPAGRVVGGRATAAPTTAEEYDAERAPELGRHTRVEHEVHRAVDDDEKVEESVGQTYLARHPRTAESERGVHLEESLGHLFEIHTQANEDSQREHLVDRTTRL